MRQTLNVTYVDEVEKTYPLTARVEVEVERKFSLALQECRNREHVYYAAWVAAGSEGDFEAFLDRVVHAEFSVDHEEEPDPTREVPPSGTSSP